MRGRKERYEQEYGRSRGMSEDKLPWWCKCSPASGIPPVQDTETNICFDFMFISLCDQARNAVKGHLPSASLAEFVGEVVFVFWLKT